MHSSLISSNKCTKKPPISNCIFSRLGDHMAASSTHGRFSRISWTLSFTKQSLFSCFYFQTLYDNCLNKLFVIVIVIVTAAVEILFTVRTLSLYYNLCRNKWEILSDGVTVLYNKIIVKHPYKGSGCHKNKKLRFLLTLIEQLMINL